MMQQELPFKMKLLTKYGDQLMSYIVHIIGFFQYIAGHFDAKHGVTGLLLALVVWTFVTLYLQIWQIFATLGLLLIQNVLLLKQRRSIFGEVQRFRFLCSWVWFVSFPRVCV